MANNEMKSQQKKIGNLRQLIIKSEPQILKALPRQIDGARMFRVYMTAVQTTPGLQDCEPISVLGAVMQTAQFGLSLESVLGEAFLIPRWNRNMGCLVAQFQLGYKGYVKLMRNADKDLRDVFAHPVHENDVFEWELGMEPVIKAHKPPLRNRGEPIAAYAVGVWKDGYKRFEIVLEDQIERVLATSDSYQKALKDGRTNTPWFTHKPAMYRKTALRQFGNRMPLQAESELVKAMTNELIDGRTFHEAGASVHELGSATQAPGLSPAAAQDDLDAAADRAEAQEKAEQDKPQPRRRSRRGRKSQQQDAKPEGEAKDQQPKADEGDATDQGSLPLPKDGEAEGADQPE